MKNNTKKFLIINSVLIILFFVIAEIFAFFSFRERCADIVYQHANMLKDNPQGYIKKNMPHYEMPRKFDYDKIVNFINRRIYLGEKSRPIITMGCSYTDGIGLDYYQTFAAKLNKYSKRTTYNRGVCASGPLFIYRQLTDENFLNEISDAEYIIYPFIYNHLSRNFRTMIQPYSSDLDLSYVLRDGKLIEKSRPFWFMYWSFLLKSYAEFKNNLDYNNELENGFPFFIEIMRESFLRMKELYPNSKFVLLEVPEGAMCYDNYISGSMELSSEEINKLKNIGIIYINAEELVGHKLRDFKYRVSDKEHPSELFWEEITPALVKKLNL